jgi:LPS-assembly protein
MSKIVFFLSFVFLFALLYAEEKTKIEVTAKHLESTKTTVTGKGGVVVYYQDSVIKADTASYNKETKMLVLDGKVEMIGYQGTKEHTKRMKINTESNEVHFEELFFVSQNDIWLITDKARRNEGNYTMGNSVISSCDANDPLWKMTFTDSLYDSNEEYMKLYNAKMYFMDVPVLYTPYMAFSTNNERSSGLLFPRFGYSEDDGFVYEQPIFWAISDSMDLELNPQIRTTRSIGGYATLRFADSAHSEGALRVGYFKDNESYINEHGYPNESHYGLEFNYESSKVFSGMLPKDYTDGLYINSTFLNDIDYLNLQKTSLEHFGLVPLQQSRLNYFLYNNDYYTGVNAKYFIDTRMEDNDETLQILPTVQFHKYLTELVKNFTYSADFQISNYHRTKGSTQQQAELRIPLEYTTAFFNDFVNISLGEEFYYSKYLFGNGDYRNDNYQYYSNFHRAKLFTDLTKKYDSFTHVIQPSLEYFRPGFENENPLKLDELIKNQPVGEPTLKDLPFAVGVPDEAYLFNLSHYFYDDKMKLKFYQRLSQKYYTDREYKLSDITNEMEYRWEKWKLYNNITYSTELSYIKDSYSQISLHKSEYNFSLGHSFKQLPSGDESEDLTYNITANDLNLRFGYTYNERIGLTGGFTYDVEEANSEQWMIGGSYKVDCWSMSASFGQNITPRPTGEATIDNAFYLQLNFIPFGSVGVSSAELNNRTY